jgi:hypothetical protein
LRIDISCCWHHDISSCWYKYFVIYSLPTCITVITASDNCVTNDICYNIYVATATFVVHKLIHGYLLVLKNLVDAIDYSLFEINSKTTDCRAHIKMWSLGIEKILICNYSLYLIMFLLCFNNQENVWIKLHVLYYGWLVYNANFGIVQLYCDVIL